MAPADQVCVAKSLCRDKGDPGASALEKRIQPSRCAMDEQRQLIGGSARQLQRSDDAVDEMWRCGKHLRCGQVAVVVFDDEVGKRAANVDRDLIHEALSESPPTARCQPYTCERSFIL